ncbi:MAG TPA: DUF2267 domain-containing protein [Gammaproteobacteria bacterium]|nr:DUF2267 domain-containing protein [Gammaproteobacteria bacterium]
MSATGFPTLDSSVQKVHEWIKDFSEEVGGLDKHNALRGLAAGLQALRDRLPVELSAHLAAQLPLVLKGFYYDGWRPAEAVRHIRQQDDYLETVIDALADPALTPRAREIVQGVFAVLDRHVSPGEMDKVWNALPESLRRLWPGGPLN